MNIGLMKASLAAAVIVVSAMTGATSRAVADTQDEWRVAAISGRPFVSNSGIVPVSLGNSESVEQVETMQIGDILEPGMWIVTPDDSRALLVRGNETIIVAPNSRMGLPTVARDGLSTTIMHSLGSILLSVDRKADPHFQVITPFLTAVVKGTTFTTTVEDQRSKVHVFEGAVRVSEPSSGADRAGDRSDLAVMFIDDDPDAGFDPFALHGPAVIDPIEIDDDAQILPMGSEFLIESGQTAGVALDNDGRDRTLDDNRNSVDRDNNPAGQGSGNSASNSGNDDGDNGPANRFLGDDSERGRSIDNGANNAPTFVADVGENPSGGGAAYNTHAIPRPGGSGQPPAPPIEEDQGGGGHGGRGF